jgi:hypothetical protein
MRGLKTNRLSYAFTSRKNEMSLKTGRDCKTFRIKYPPGETWYYTFDPRNLQAVLATQFQDFQQPEDRVGAFQALLGMGIVRFTCATWNVNREPNSNILVLSQRTKMGTLPRSPKTAIHARTNS